MGALREMLDVRELSIELNRTKAELVEAERDIRLLARALASTQEFYDWLLMQDPSSAVMLAPSGKIKKVLVENQDDLTLALAFIASRAG
jgi:ABC-type phosphate transport system ATPase subunit